MMRAKNQYRIEGQTVWMKLTQGRETCFDLCFLVKLAPHRWCASKERGRVYAVTNVRGKRGTTLGMHRLILSTTSKEVDHIRGSGLDNRLYNLRPATTRQNQQNRSKSLGTSSQFKGVSWNKRVQKWHAYIRHYKKRVHLGFFDDEHEASAVYNKAATRLFGKFARLNVTTCF